MYVFLSGNIEVFHVVFPMVACTGNEPKPRAWLPYASLIALESFLSRLTKCQGVSPGQSHMLALVVYVFFTLFRQYRSEVLLSVSSRTHRQLGVRIHHSLDSNCILPYIRMYLEFPYLHIVVHRIPSLYNPPL